MFITYLRMGALLAVITVASASLAVIVLTVALNATVFVVIAVAALLVARWLLPAAVRRQLRDIRRASPRRGVEPRSPVVEVERPTADVPPEYLPLHAYLDRRYATTVVLTFDQMEALLGRPLPDSARTDDDWWTDDASGGERQSEAWIAARRGAAPNFQARTVTFERLP